MWDQKSTDMAQGDRHVIEVRIRDTICEPLIFGHTVVKITLNDC